MKSRLLIDANRIRIRNLEEDDLLDFHFYRSNPEVTKHQGFDVYSKAEVFIQKQVHKEFGEIGEWVQYGIVNKSTSKIIGDCAIRLDDVKLGNAEIGITISHIEQRKGYGKEALIAIVDFLFSSANIHKIEERLSTENKASKQLLLASGFTQEGAVLNDVLYKGKVGDEYLFVMSRDEWESRKQLDL